MEKNGELVEVSCQGEIIACCLVVRTTFMLITAHRTRRTTDGMGLPFKMRMENNGPELITLAFKMRLGIMGLPSKMGGM